MTTPQRIQSKRTKGWHRPANAVIVTRNSRWGNPFRVDDYTAAGHTEAEARALAVDDYAAWLDGTRHHDLKPAQRARIRAELHTLRGHDLACTCPLDGLPCHGDVLIAQANTPDPR
jgi:hypothetical protein